MSIKYTIPGIPRILPQEIVLLSISALIASCGHVFLKDSTDVPGCYEFGHLQFRLTESSLISKNIKVKAITTQGARGDVAVVFRPGIEILGGDKNLSFRESGKESSLATFRSSVLGSQLVMFSKNGQVVQFEKFSCS